MYKEGVTLITCTGGRDAALDLCIGFVLRQTWKGPLQLIVVDDVASNDPPTKATVALFNAEKRGRLLVTVELPSPVWRPGQNTLARNLLAAIPRVMYDKVFFIEDDDWYSPSYISDQIQPLSECDLVGDPLSLYYHVPSKQYRRMVNESSASLCQTAMRASMLPELRAVCLEAPDFIDHRLWTRPLAKGKRRAFTHYGGVVGMKGLPGRPGIGVGHRPQERPEQWQDDSDLKVLRSWIGIDDVELYRRFML